MAVLGGAADISLCNEIVGQIGEHAFSLAGKSSLLESAELLRRCRLLVCNDSGLQHLASAVGTQCLSLFSCRDFKGRWYPHGSGHTVIRKWVDCHTCFRDSCPYDDRCIRLIQTDEVVATVDRKIPEENLGRQVGGAEDGRRCS